MNTEQLIARLNEQHTSVMARFQEGADAAASMQSRWFGVEQTLGAGRGGGPMFRPRAATWGGQVGESDRLKQFVAEGLRGSCRIPITASITTPTGVEQRDLVAPERGPIQGLPQQILTVRDLIGAVPTTSNLIQYVRQVSRTNNAAPVAAGEEKPESDLGFELAEAPVRTIAHWIPVPRQTFEDVAGLGAVIDS